MLPLQERTLIFLKSHQQ